MHNMQRSLDTAEQQQLKLSSNNHVLLFLLIDAGLAILFISLSVLQRTQK